MSTTPIAVAREALEAIARGATFQHPDAVEKRDRAARALDAIKALEVEAEARAAGADASAWVGARLVAAIRRAWRSFVENASDGRVPPPPPGWLLERRSPCQPTGWELEVASGGACGTVEIRRGDAGTDAGLTQIARVIVETVTRLAPPGAFPPAPGGPGRAGLQFTIGPVTDKRNRTMLVLKATQKVLLSLVFEDAKGNPARVDGPPAWNVSAPEVGSLEVADDGLSATLSAGTVTTGQVNVTADADLGDGVKTITGVLDVQILAGDAALIAISAAAPEDQ